MSIDKIKRDLFYFIKNPWYCISSAIENNYHFIELFLTALAVSVATFLYLETRKEVLNSDKQVAIADTTSHDELRAYVGVTWIKPIHYKKNHEMAKINITNFGKTPARRVTLDYQFDCLGRDTLWYVQEMFNSQDSVRDQYTLFPGEAYILPVRPTGDGEIISSKYWKDPSKDRLYARQIYGKLIYYDNRGIKRATVFAFQWEFRTHIYRRVGGMNYIDNDQTDTKDSIYVMTKMIPVPNSLP